MPPRRRVDPAVGRAALDAWQRDPDGASADVVAAAVRFSLEELVARHGGNAVEVRVPPYGAVQCVPGPAHRRGTPANVVETDGTTWLELVTGRISWRAGVGAGRISASGPRADLSALVPLLPGSPCHARTDSR